MGMDIILGFPLNHYSLLLTYKYSILHVSAKFGVDVQWHDSLHMIALLAKINFCLFVCLCAFVIECSLNLGYIFQQGGVSSRFGPSQRCAGSAKTLSVSQLFMSIQYNVCPFKFHLLQSFTIPSDTAQFCTRFLLNFVISGYNRKYLILFRYL